MTSVIWLGTHRKCGRTVRFETPHDRSMGRVDFGTRTAFGKPLGIVSYNYDRAIVDCVCGSPMYVSPVRGRKNKTKCGATCQSATGPNCDCSCAGANHGNAHG